VLTKRQNSAPVTSGEVLLEPKVRVTLTSFCNISINIEATKTRKCALESHKDALQINSTFMWILEDFFSHHPLALSIKPHPNPTKLEYWYSYILLIETKDNDRHVIIYWHTFEYK
jgi:hypothetical protein